MIPRIGFNSSMSSSAGSTISHVPDAHGMRCTTFSPTSCAIGNFRAPCFDEIYLARKRFIDRREKGTSCKSSATGG